MDFFLEAANRPFTIALGILIGIGLLEGLSQLIGLGFSNLLDSLLPDMDFDADLDLSVDLEAEVDMDLDMDADIDADVTTGGPSGPGEGVAGLSGPNAFFSLLGWFHIGRVPTLVLLILFLFSFSLGGFGIQMAADRLFGSPLSGPVASGAALVLAFLFVKVFGAACGRIIPKEETEAVSVESLIGREATIVLGTATVGRAAQAKVRDDHGKVHYLMVEPAEEGVAFRAGEGALLIERKGAVFLAIPAS